MINKLLTSICFFLIFSANAQNLRNEKFGSVKIEDFSPKSPILKDDDAAVILSDVGLSEFIGNNNGSFTIVFKQHKKILIKKKTAFDEASFKIKLYQGNYETEEKLEDVQAATYNLENGNIITSKLNKDNVIKEKYNRLYSLRKFTLPDVKEGCIIEYSYTLKSQFDTHLRSWDFQDDYPTLWSEYQVTIPPMYNYFVVKKGDYKDLLCVDSRKNIFKSYSILFPGENTYSSASVGTFSGNAKWALWAMKDVPKYKKEIFLANHIDYKTSFEFQLQSIKYSETILRQRIKSWYQTASDLLKSESFGQILDKEKNGWIEKEVSNLTGKLEGIECAKQIFTFVRDNFDCINHDANRLSDEPKKIFKAKKGNVADINLLLTAMLYQKGFIASPVLLSTRGNGKASEISAILEEYDYVICQLKIDSATYFLDASKSKNGFDKLPSFCYNGYGRMIAETPYLVDLSANKLIENKTTVVFMINGENKKSEASFESKLGYIESQDLRDKLITKSNADYLKEVSKDYPMDVKIENLEIENKNNLDESINLKYDFKFNFTDDDIIYFNPLLAEATKENMFKAEKRKFPVELPFLFNETYILDMEIPTGYKVDEMPKSVRSKFNETEGLFEYIIANKDGHIQLRCKFQLNKANYDADDYDSLRDFFGLFVKKQSEQIVFKKIK